MKNMIRFEKVDGIIISMSVENFFEDGINFKKIKIKILRSEKLFLYL